MDSVTITIDAELFKRLQSFAEPLVDTFDTVIKKLCDNWEYNPPSTLAELHRMHEDVYSKYGPGASGLVVDAIRERNALAHGGVGALTGRQIKLIRAYLEQFYDRGIFRFQKNELPLGLPLTAEYQGKTLKAVVTECGIEVNNEVYESPSAAAVAAKKALGVDEKAAQTNGWTFWTFGRGSSMGAFPLNTLRQVGGGVWGATNTVGDSGKD